MKKIILVEDILEYHQAVATGLDATQEKWCLTSFTAGREAMKFSESGKFQPDLAIVDLGLPDVSGLEVIQKFKKNFPAVKIMVFTVIPEKNTILEAMRNGADGYILKDDTYLPFENALMSLLDGLNPISPQATTCLLDHGARAKPEQNLRYNLSRQEQKLLTLIYEGKSYAAAAEMMNLKLNTIHAYSRSLFKKMRVNSKTQAVAKAREIGLC